MQERDRPQMLQAVPGRAQRGPADAARGYGVPASDRRGFGGRSPIYQKMASGFTGEPVPPGTRSGAITSMKSH